ncbi:MAG: flavodoxin domain-containing protein [Nakamurella sp.]
MTSQHIAVLVSYASKMGGTEGIANAIGAELARAGLDVQVRDAGDVTSVHGYDAAVVGSAIYASRWRPEAIQVLEQLAAKADEFTATPTWLFHSGPCGPTAGSQQVVAPRRVRGLAHRIGAAPPVTFGGRLEKATAKGFLAQQMAKGKLAGDFRDFARITAWADTIAQHLTSADQPQLPSQTLPAQQRTVLHAPDVFANH